MFRGLIVFLIGFVPQGTREYYVDGVNEYEFRARRKKRGPGPWIVFWLEAFGSVFRCQWIWLKLLVMKAWKVPFHIPARQLSLVAFCLTLFISIFVLFGLADPKSAIDKARGFVTPLGLYFGVMFRLALGLLLIGAANASRMPRTVKTFGVLSLIGGLFLLMIGIEGVTAWFTWWEARGIGTIRALMAISFTSFLFLTLVLTPSERETHRSIN